MKDRLERLKKVTLELSNLVDNYVKSTSPSRLPLRASDLEEYAAVKKIVRENKYQHLSQLLKEIVYHQLNDLIPSLSYEVFEKSGRPRHNWYFNIAKPLAVPSPNPTASPINFEIDTSDLCKSSFSEREVACLNRYAKNLERLITGELHPETEAQERFKQVASDLLRKVGNKTKPRSFYEKLIVKYVIYERYIERRLS